LRTSAPPAVIVIAVLSVCPRIGSAADSEAARLVEQSSFIFRGTVQQAQPVATKPSEPKADRASVRVDQVISLANGAQQALGDLKGKTVTVVDTSGAHEPLKNGDQWTFYANGLQYGESVTLELVGRVKEGGVSIKTFQPNLFAADLVGEKTLPEHVTEAEAIVTGRVVSVRPLPQPKLQMLAAAMQSEKKPPSEHDPKYREAVIQVGEALKGNLPEKKVVVIFAASKDVRWYSSPKLKEGQEGTFILHKEQVKDEAERTALLSVTPAEAGSGQIFTALDPKDTQPANSEKVKHALEP
jgi:hypothetical protein